MRVSKWAAFALVVAVVSGLSGRAFAAEAGKKELAMTKKLVAMMGLGRQVITIWQSTINDANKGDKGLNADKFQEELGALLKAKDIDIGKLEGKKDMASKEMLLLLASMKQVIADAQPLINKQGMGFKGFLPAVFARKSLEAFKEKSKIKGKLTAIQPRNVNNAPDEFEKSALKEFLDRSKDDPKRDAPITRVVKTDNGTVLRYVSPEFYKGKCLDCHGGPKGDKDITGFPKEGFEEGAAGAALSFVVPVGK